MHNKKEICKLTKQTIDTTKERYVILLECNGKEIESVGFYKYRLFKELLLGNIKEAQKHLMENSKRLLGGILSKFSNKKEVYQI